MSDYVVQVPEDSPPTVLMRLVNEMGTLYSAGDFSSIEYASHTWNDGTEILAFTSITPGDVVLGEFEHPRWPHRDLPNFLHTPSYQIVPTGGVVYQLVYKFTPTSGSPFYTRKFKVTAEAQHGH